MRVWNACGLEWQALEMMAEIHGVTDIETFIAELMAIRDFLGATND